MDVLAQSWAPKGIERRRQATEVLPEVCNTDFSLVRTLQPALATVPRIFEGWEAQIGWVFSNREV